MELRFAGAARATKYLDLGLDGDRAYRLSSFAAALGLGFDDFTLRSIRIFCIVLKYKQGSAAPGYSFAFVSLRRKVSLAAWVLRSLASAD